jgi:hypothetical protein
MKLGGQRPCSLWAGGQVRPGLLLSDVTSKRQNAKTRKRKIQALNHGGRYLEQHQTEKTETAMRDVNRIRINKSVRMVSRVDFWGVIRALQSKINIYFYPQPAAPHL